MKFDTHRFCRAIMAHVEFWSAPDVGDDERMGEEERNALLDAVEALERAEDIARNQCDVA